jgi:cytochrome c-type biogenesis protein CcmH
MTLFWLIGAALAAVALGLVLRPLLSRRPGAQVSRDAANRAIYRDQLRELDADLAAGKIAAADHARARAEIEARVLEDVSLPQAGARKAPGRATALAVGVAVPVLAIAVYLATGTPSAVEPQMQAGSHQVEALVARLAERLRQRPDDLDGWVLLARSYDAMGRSAEAAKAFDEAEKRAEGALQRDPNHLTALALAGGSAFRRGDYRAAAGYWERMLPQLPPGSEEAAGIQANIDEARRIDQEKAATALRGTVRLAPQLKNRVAPDDTVFIFARAAEGPPMPLAVLRKRVRELPASFALDDSMAMTPQMKLSSFSRVVVGARVSKTGNATPQPGDLQGLSAPVANAAQGVNVVIDGEVAGK